MLIQHGKQQVLSVFFLRGLTIRFAWGIKAIEITKPLSSTHSVYSALFRVRSLDDCPHCPNATWIFLVSVVGLESLSGPSVKTVKSQRHLSRILTVLAIHALMSFPFCFSSVMYKLYSRAAGIAVCVFKSSFDRRRFDLWPPCCNNTPRFESFLRQMCVIPKEPGERAFWAR